MGQKEEEETINKRYDDKGKKSNGKVSRGQKTACACVPLTVDYDGVRRHAVLLLQ